MVLGLEAGETGLIAIILRFIFSKIGIIIILALLIWLGVLPFTTNMIFIGFILVVFYILFKRK